MQKVVRYQLVLMSDGIGKALLHVSEARVKERDSDQDIEIHTFAARRGPTDFLLARLSNDQLANAIPITVYRLGMFGGSRAVEPLRERLAEWKTRDPAVAALVERAIERIVIRSRYDS
jgi:hypothetical protein